MCNVYRIEPLRSPGDRLAEAVSALAASLSTTLIRKTLPGLVVLSEGRVEAMRWGFHRQFNPSINNARSDKLASPAASASSMWSEAFHTRRCAVPMTAFYEWAPAEDGRRARKQAHRFRSAGASEGSYLWVAGLWEEHPRLGPCFAVVTTESAPPVSRIHHRMPALLQPHELGDYLGAPTPSLLRPRPGLLQIAPCDSPLTTSPPKQPTPKQPELF